jgi:hypothetical protein
MHNAPQDPAALGGRDEATLPGWEVAVVPGRQTGDLVRLE